MRPSRIAPAPIPRTIMSALTIRAQSNPSFAPPFDSSAFAPPDEFGKPTLINFPAALVVLHIYFEITSVIVTQYIRNLSSKAVEFPLNRFAKQESLYLFIH